MFLFGNAKVVSNIKRILGWVGGGVNKRIDENRELLELLRREAPDLVAKHPEIVNWLQSNDDFLCELHAVVPLEDAQFKSLAKGLGTGFPRPWPGEDTESLRRQIMFSTWGKTQRTEGPMPYSVAGHLDPNWSWWLVWNTNPPECEKGDGPHAWKWEEVLPGDELEAKLRAMGLSEAIPGWAALMGTDRTYINGRWMKIAACQRIKDDNVEINIRGSQRNSGRNSSALVQINIGRDQRNAGGGFHG